MIELTEKEFREYFSTNPHPFLSEEFINLHKHKVDRVIYLVSGMNKPEVGLLAGIKNRKLICPVSAPFGGLFFRSKFSLIDHLDDFLEDLKKYIHESDIEMFEIIMHPSLYNSSSYSKSISSFIRNGYEFATPEITSWVELDQLKDEFNYRNAKRNCERARKKKLKFGLAKNDKDKEKFYQVVKENRARFNRPIYMTFEDLMEVNKIWPVDFFKVSSEDDTVLASAIAYKFTSHISYIVFWGDGDLGRTERGAMDYLAYNVLAHYKKLGFRYVDLGISTESGIPNSGLLRFKETKDSITSLRFQFTYKSS